MEYRRLHALFRAFLRKMKGMPQIWNPFEELRPGKHMVVCGMSGAGKSEALRSEAGRLVLSGHAVVLVDGKGDPSVWAKMCGFAVQAGRQQDLRVLNTLTGGCQFLGKYGVAVYSQGTPQPTHTLELPSTGVPKQYRHLFAPKNEATVDFLSTSPIILALLPSPEAPIDVFQGLRDTILAAASTGATARHSRGQAPCTVILDDVVIPRENRQWLTSFLSAMKRANCSVIIGVQNYSLIEGYLPVGAEAPQVIYMKSSNGHEDLLFGQFRRDGEVVELPYLKAPPVSRLDLWQVSPENSQQELAP